MLPQVHVFHDGSAVCHRLTFADRPGSRYSVWVRADGSPITAERIDRAGRAYDVRGAQMLDLLAKRAAVWVAQSRKPAIVEIPATA